jgi:hypothetical protein
VGNIVEFSTPVSKLTPKPIWTLRLSESRRVSLPDCVVISDEIANQISWRKRLFVSVAPNRTLAIIYIFENFRRALVKSSMVSRGARELLGIPHSLQVSCVCGHLFVMKDVGVLRMLSRNRGKVCGQVTCVYRISVFNCGYSTALSC